METQKEKSLHFRETCFALLFLVLANMAVAPTGNTSNGGILGLVFLSVSSYLSWKGFLLNNASAILRLLFQCPITILCSYLVIRNVYCQCVSGWWSGI